GAAATTAPTQGYFQPCMPTRSPPRPIPIVSWPNSTRPPTTSPCATGSKAHSSRWCSNSGARFGLAPGRIKEFASAPARRRPDHPPVRTFPPRHKHDRGSTMRQHPRLHGVDVRSWLQELFGATSWQTLGFDEPVDDLLTFAELL